MTSLARFSDLGEAAQASPRRSCAVRRKGESKRNAKRDGERRGGGDILFYLQGTRCQAPVEGTLVSWRRDVRDAQATPVSASKKPAGSLIRWQRYLNLLFLLLMGDQIPFESATAARQLFDWLQKNSFLYLRLSSSAA